MQKMTMDDIELACLQIILERLIDDLSAVTPNATSAGLTELLLAEAESVIGVDSGSNDDQNGQSLKELKIEHVKLSKEYDKLRILSKSMADKFLDEIDHTKLICAYEERMIDSWTNAQIAKTETEHADQMDIRHGDRQQIHQQLLTNALIADTLSDYEMMKLAELEATLTFWHRKYANDLAEIENEEKLFERIAAKFRTERSECMMAFDKMTAAIIEANQMKSNPVVGIADKRFTTINSIEP